MKNLNISLFKGYSDKCPSTAALADIVNLIRESSAVQEHTEKHRYFLAHGNDAAARREKIVQPVLCSGRTLRRRQGARAHT